MNKALIVKCVPYCMLGLVILSLLVRYGDLREPSLSRGDEALTAVRSLSLLDEGHFWTPHWNGTVNLHKPPAYYWLVASGFLAFGIDELAVRLPSVICFVLLLCAVFQINKKLYNVWPGVFAVALLSVHPVLVNQSRAGMMDTMVALLFVLGGSCLWFTGKDKRYYYGWGLVCGLALLAKGGGAIACLPISLLYLAIADRSAFKNGHFYAALCLFFLLPGIWFLSQYIMHKEALFNTYFAREVSYRLSGHNIWDTFCLQKTTIRLWHSFGSIAPLGLCSSIFVFFIDRSDEDRRWVQPVVFFHIMLIVGISMMNLVKQQMYWYIIPGVIPVAVFIGIVLWAVMTGKLNKWLGIMVCASIFAGTFLGGANKDVAQALLWIARTTVVVMAIFLWFGPKVRCISSTLLVIVMGIVVWSGMSCENKSVSLSSGHRDSSDLKILAEALALLNENDDCVMVDFRDFHLNSFMFYSQRNTVHVNNFNLGDLSKDETRYAVLVDTDHDKLDKVQIDVLMEAGKFELVTVRKPKRRFRLF